MSGMSHRERESLSLWCISLRLAKLAEEAVYVVLVILQGAIKCRESHKSGHRRRPSGAKAMSYIYRLNVKSFPKIYNDKASGVLCTGKTES